MGNGSMHAKRSSLQVCSCLDCTRKPAHVNQHKA